MDESKERFVRELAYWRQEIERRSRDTANIADARVRLEAIAKRIERRVTVLESSSPASRKTMEAEISNMMWLLARETCRVHLGLTTHLKAA